MTRIDSSSNETRLFSLHLGTNCSFIAIIYYIDYRLSILKVYFQYIKNSWQKITINICDYRFM